MKPHLLRGLCAVLCLALTLSACSTRELPSESSEESFAEPSPPPVSTVEPASEPELEPDEPDEDTIRAQLRSSFYLPADSDVVAKVRQLGGTPIAQAGGPASWTLDAGSLARCYVLSYEDLTLPLDALLPGMYYCHTTAGGNQVGDAAFYLDDSFSYFERLSKTTDTLDLDAHLDQLLILLEAMDYDLPETRVVLSLLNGPEPLGYFFLLDDGQRRHLYQLESTHMSDKLALQPGTLTEAERMAGLMRTYYAGAREAYYLPETFYEEEGYDSYWHRQNGDQLLTDEEVAYQMADAILRYRSASRRFTLNESFTDAAELDPAVVIDIAATAASHFSISPSVGDAGANSDPILEFLDNRLKQGLTFSYPAFGEDVRKAAQELFGDRYTLPAGNGELFVYNDELDLYYVPGEWGVASVEYPIVLSCERNGGELRATVLYMSTYFGGEWSTTDGSWSTSTDNPRGETAAYLRENRDDMQQYRYTFTESQNGALRLKSFELL